MLENFDEKVADLVKEAMKDNLSGNLVNAPFISIQDFTAKTGKRFRMTKAQKDAGLSREQAFTEFVNNLVTKD
jgi:hypothetical protein